MSVGRGSRTDLVDFKERIKEGKRKRELWDTHTLQMAKYPKMYTSLLACYMPQRNKPLLVCLLVGSTGTGKTYWVHNRWKDKEQGYWTMPISHGACWFDGYDMHKRVLMDDFAGRMSKMPLQLLLWVLDVYPRYLPIKYGYTWWLPRYIVLTSNYHPRLWYDWKDREEGYNALARRITQVVTFDRDENKSVVTCDLADLDEYFAKRPEERNINDVLNKDFKHKTCSNCNKCIQC